MFKSYVRITFRNLIKYKSYSFINIAGLAVGMACCLLIMLYVRFELSYDHFYKDSDRIYRVWREFTDPDGQTNLTLGPISPNFAPLFKSDFPEFEKVTQMLPDGGTLMSRDNRFFNEPELWWADENASAVFSFHWLDGDAKTALNAPNSIVLTRSTAKKYFGDENAMEQILTYEKQRTFKVTGIIEDPPLNSHFHFDFLASLSTLKNIADSSSDFLNSWGSNNFSTYVRLKEGESPQAIDDKFPAFIDRHLPLHLGLKPSRTTKLHMQPVTDIHLHSHLNSEVGENSDIAYIYVLSAVALFVLIIACINYMNLATARSMRRAKEVGMRKVLGAYRSQLIKQFLGESVFTTWVAFIIAVGIVEFTLPAFDGFVNRSLTFDYFSNPRELIVLITLTTVIGILTGSYPAFYLARFRPITVLKNIKGSSNTKSGLRSALVIMQFSISIMLIICMGVVRNQLDYVRTKDLGFNKEQIIVLPSTDKMIGDLEAFKGKLLQNSNILSVSASKRIPSDRLNDAGTAQIIRNDKVEDVNFRIASLNVDHDYIPTFGFSLVAGRNFQKNLSGDSTKAFIINEKAAAMLGWKSPQEATGQRFLYSGRDGFIIGVVKDFNFESLHQPISPLVMRISTSSLFKIAVRLRPEDFQGTIGFLQSVWQEYRPDYPFEYQFIDERFDMLYRNEHKLGQMFALFAGLSIFIACLGLLGLASFMTEQRTKEIGIRRVLGATVVNITSMISKEFVKYIVAASAIAWAVAYYGMNEWLKIFAYRIEMNYLTFILASLTALAIALATVGYQAIKAATANPVEALKYE